AKSTLSEQTPQSKRVSETKKSPETEFVDIEIDINEGIQTIVKSSQIKGLDEELYNQEKILTPAKAMEQLSLRPGEPFREYMVKSDENALSMMISEIGYPHVKITSNVMLNSDKSTADLVWNVQKGKFTRFGNIHYSGNTRLKEEVIEKRLEIVSGEPFSLKKIFATEKKIRESSAVKYVQVTSPELALMKESPDIEIAIEEAKPYFVEAAIGYDTEQSFYIDTRIGDNNFLGREIDAWVAANVSGIGYRGETGLKKPFFLGTEIDATAGIYVEDKEELNKDFGIKAWGYESGFSRHLFVKNLTAALNLTYENRTVYGDADIDTSEKETRNILITSFALGYDTRDSLVRPSKGFLSSCSVDVYTGFDSELDRFLKYQIDLRKYVSPLNKTTFALRTRMGYIQPFGEADSVAKDQLFFLGGTTNVRGFKENMLEYDSNGNTMGGQTAVNASLEARVDLPADFELNCFLDTGKIDELSNNLESRGFRSSVGAGLRYVTSIGPVGLLYGYKLDPEDGESAGRIHFSVGYTF
ncbi:MAG: BamA/TamA family outer membrane protein, partial [Desulfamplus sp.]|nr:BamA/TamA family outer membrane protein [Desulfamplus sp.]